MSLISFLTPAYNNPRLLMRAVLSLQLQSCPDWEMVVAPDDGHDYRGLLAAMDSRISFAPANGAVRSGPGAARNRALLCAKGDFVACLDENDMLAPNFVEAVSKALQSYSVVTVPSAYITNAGEELRTIGAYLDCMDIAEFAEQYGIMHTISHRSKARPWTNSFAQDVVHTCAAIDNSYGELPVVRSTTYIVSTSEWSDSADKLVTDEQYANLSYSHFDNMTASAAQATRSLFEKRLAMSIQFAHREDRYVGYHEFVAAQQMTPCFI